MSTKSTGMVNLLNFSIPALTPLATMKAHAARKTRCIIIGDQVEVMKLPNMEVTFSGSVFTNSIAQDLRRKSRDQPPMTL